MSGYLNKVQLIGNLGRDPEGRSTQGGKRVVALSVATSESWKDQAGNRVERTEWHRVVICRPLRRSWPFLESGHHVGGYFRPWRADVGIWGTRTARVPAIAASV
jgi:single stranded DNA-binding protein